MKQQPDGLVVFMQHSSSSDRHTEVEVRVRGEGTAVTVQCLASDKEGRDSSILSS